MAAEYGPGTGGGVRLYDDKARCMKPAGGSPTGFSTMGLYQYCKREGGVGGARKEPSRHQNVESRLVRSRAPHPDQVGKPIVLARLSYVKAASRAYPTSHLAKVEGVGSHPQKVGD